MRNLVDRLQSVPDAWRDDAMLNRMVELAKLTGDIRQNDLVPDRLVFRHDAFWANHFGGVYVFLDDKATTVICDPSVPGFRKSRPWQVSYISIRDPAVIYDFLARTNRLELPQASTIGQSGLLAHRAGYGSGKAHSGSRSRHRSGKPSTPSGSRHGCHRNAASVAADGTLAIPAGNDPPAGLHGHIENERSGSGQPLPPGACQGPVIRING